MSGDEVVSRDAVAVREDQVFLLGGHNGAVEDLSLPKSAVLVPDVEHVEAALGRYPVDYLGCRGTRPVISDDELELRSALTRIAPHHLFQLFRLIVRRD